MIKDKVLGWLFKGYSKRVRDNSDKALHLQMEAFKATLDIKDLIRERLKGVRPAHPDDGSLLQSHLAGLDDNARLGFLSKATEVLNNPTFQVVAKSLILDSEREATLEADTMAEVNFNRASINGIQLVEDSMTLLDSMYREESDLQKKMTDAERLAPL